MIKKLLIVGALACSLVGAKAIAQATGTAVLGWDNYTNNPASLLIKVYGVPGSNTVFTVSNSNATAVVWTGATNNTVSVPNLSIGYWTFTATAATAANGGTESSNSTVAVGLIRPGAVTNLKIISTTP